MKVVFIDDGIMSGATAGNIIEGCRKAGATVLHAGFIIEVQEQRGRASPKMAGVPITSVVSLHLRGERTKVSSTCAMVVDVPPQPPAPTLRQIRALTGAQLDASKTRIEAAFVGIPIVHNPRLSYPYSFFQLTDFKPVMTADVVEIMADLCCYYADMARCDLIVSEADRGGGPLAHAVARRLNLPYVLSPSGPPLSPTSTPSMPPWWASSQGWGSCICERGGERDMRCAFVDDMLSSGGTAEGVLRAVVAAGGIPVEAVEVCLAKGGLIRKKHKKTPFNF